MCGAKVKNSVITVSVRTKSDANMAHVSVQDKGPGLDAETAKRVFEPFFTTKKSGIGMGLAISRALTEANGGQLWLDLNTDIGATFHFTLPFAP
jgi:signal transduction histidine kinase